VLHPPDHPPASASHRSERNPLCNPSAPDLQIKKK
jgi:hypothetical protein